MEEVKAETEVKQSKNKVKLRRGGRNLILLGTASILIALATTCVSLAIYHNSGDIYLDRSRPGYLPDENEVEEDEKNEKNEEVYDFGKDGELTAEGLTEYLEMLKTETELIDSYEKPFSEDALSDNKLGIPADRVEE